MKVIVERVSIPAMSTIGYGWGVDAENENRSVHFAGDHRPMLAIGEVLEAWEYVEVDVPSYAVLSIEEGPGQGVEAE